MSAVFGGSSVGDKGLRMPLLETIRHAWADPDLRQRILFVLFIFGVFALGVNISIPVKGMTGEELAKALQSLPMFQMLDMFGGGALKKMSIFALGLNPYITASIVMQILSTAIPSMKKELQEGGQYARQQQNKRTKALTFLLCIAQGWGLMQAMSIAVSFMPFEKASILIFWTAGSMFMLWLGEQLTEKGIGNGVSMMIFAGIIISLPSQMHRIYQSYADGFTSIWQILILTLVFLAVTWLVVLFTTAQRRIPIQHMRRQVGTRQVGGQTNYLPLSLNLAGVIPIIFAVSLAYIPSQFASYVGPRSPMYEPLENITRYITPSATFPVGLVGSIVYTLLILFFTYFYTAIQYNVEDLSDNLKRHGSFIPGIRPGKQTRDFLDGVISRITIVGAGFLAIIALMQSMAPAITGINYTGTFFGTSLLIIVSVALETMRQIEANILMKQYGQG